MSESAGLTIAGEIPESEQTLPLPYRLVGGRQWIADLPPGFGGASDTATAPTASRLRLCEDGVELGPAHALHAEIERDGRGRYSHWEGKVRFSVPDGGDPNVNGRRYTVSLAEPLLRLLGLGSCHVHDALDYLDRRRLAHRVWPDACLSYSPRETLQLIEICHRRLQVPNFLLGVDIATRAIDALPGAVATADIAFIELDTSVDVSLGTTVIAPNALTSTIVDPICALGREERLLAKRWYRLGLRKCDETIRRQAVDELLPLLPRVLFDEPKLAAEVVRHARGFRQSPAEAARTIDEIRDTLGVEVLCILSGHNIYLPDGRPLSWPVNFAQELESICAKLELPLLHPSDLIIQRGAAFSLNEDLHHFTPQFLGVLGEAMLAMGRRAFSAR